MDNGAKYYIGKYWLSLLILAWVFISGYITGLNLKPRLYYPISLEIDYGPLETRPPEEVSSTKENNHEVQGAYFASVNGKKYYAARCASSKRIKIENRVWFENEKDALDSGLSPSKNC